MPPESSACVPIALLKTAIEWRSGSVAIMDHDLRYIAVNAAWTAMTGISETDALGHTAVELMGDLARVAEPDFRAALAGRETTKSVSTPYEPRLREVTIGPWRDGTGAICGVIAQNAIQDIGGRRSLSRDRRLNVAMALAKVYAYEIDFRTGKISYEPDGPPETKGARFHSYEDILAWQPQEGRQAHREIWERHLATGELMVQEYPRFTPDGGVCWQMSVSEAVRDPDNNVVGVIGMTQVIDDRKRAELALIAEKDAAQAADRAKSEFLANISHEIRTPLNGVLGLASLLGRTALTAAQTEMVRTIETSAQTLNVLLSDILDLAKIEAGRLELGAQAFDPAELVEHVYNLFSPAAAAKGLEFICEIDESLGGAVVGDQTRLGQVLTNLCSNAVKFTAQGRVAIRAWAADDDNGQRLLSFAVSDTGVGIAEDMLGRLFERFVQADGSTSRSFGGSGLGLAISRTLARLMGGDVEVVSGVGQGSTFTLTIRVASARPAEAPDAPTPDAPQTAALERPPRVLLVEDHPVNRRVVELILDGLVSLDCAENGAEGLAAFKANAFDVVLMDMQMPVMDGLEATRQIRAFERAGGRAPTPIIMLSANAMGEHVKAGQDAGADFHLAKPITADGLAEAIARAIEAPAASDAPLAATG